MGNSGSSVVPPTNPSYQTSTLLDSFFSNVTSPPPSLPPQCTLGGYRANPDASPDSALVFRSSDEQYLQLRRRDIDAHTRALIPPTWSSDTLVIELPEPIAVLRVLFSFIGARTHPSLLTEEFDSLAAIAKAAEKYKVYSAINICAERMRAYGNRHPKLVLLYAAHNDHSHVFDECAPRVVTSENFESLIPLLPEEYRLPWLRYHAQWSAALGSIAQYSYTIPYNAWSNRTCWKGCGRWIFQALGAGVHALNDPSWIFETRVKAHTDGCTQCKKLCSEWKSHAQSMVDEIGVFSERYMNASEGSTQS
ncbi:hypothetical protein NP233_g3551 [Leucocoprinus birnbaumii]|uniref:BTB domain-containing protein n=1 Tax=Leucocoprinus birnbaumii TaxID=56174 RepID=A0AAD5VWU4_9AGAR|nr:hypothetical protein NP233_g3551 [Leucocoprinus birnbaumii]